MRTTINGLLTQGITVDKGEYGKVTIKVTADEIFSVYKKIESYKLKEEEKAYKLYGELGNLIHGKLLCVVNDKYFAENSHKFRKCLSTGFDIVKNILALPVMNFPESMELCAKMTKAMLSTKDDVQELSENLSSDKDTTLHKNQKLINDYKKLGMFFAFTSRKLAQEMLPAAKFATEIGMKTPLFVAESSPKLGRGLSHNIGFIAIAARAVDKEKTLHGTKQNLTYNQSHNTFYHEITHHARSTVEALHTDKTLARKNLSETLKGHDDVIATIKKQFRNYSLTDEEEYIADFSARVLCCLEQDQNPFDYIDDERLWRLYYEFGGPDFAPIINERIFKNDKHNMLTDKNFDWCSGYPSKFGIDVKNLKHRILISGNYAVDHKTKFNLNEKTILPPPPLGYCYTTEKGRLQLKVDKNVLPNSTDDTLYDPTFCSLTNGPLTLMKTEPHLVHHFELLPAKSSGVSKMFNTEASQPASSTSIPTTSTSSSEMFNTEASQPASSTSIPTTSTSSSKMFNTEASQPASSTSIPTTSTSSGKVSSNKPAVPRSESYKDVKQKNSTNNSVISTIGSVVVSIVKLPVTAIKLVLGWFSSDK